MRDKFKRPHLMFHRLPHSPGLLNSLPSTPQFPQPSPLFRYTHCSPLLLLFPAQSPHSAPQISSRARPPLSGPLRSTPPHSSSPKRPPPPAASATAGRPRPNTQISHPPHSRSRRRHRPRRRPHCTPAPPCNTPPARGPLTTHAAGGTVGKANGERLASPGAYTSL